MEKEPETTVQRILIVEDEAVMGRFLMRVLAKPGREVVIASSYREGLKAIQENSKIDAALIDVNLESYDGIRLAILLRDLRPGLRIVVMSGNPSNELRVIQTGFGAMLAKPFTIEELEERIFIKNLPS
ncbi:MAG: response regulator [Elusimicrobiota bacterium]